MIRLGLGKKISNSQTVISLMFRRNITLGHRFWSRKLSRKVICSRAEFTGKLAQMAFKITGGFTHQQLTAGQRNDVNNFFFLAIEEKIHHDGSESKAESAANVKRFISLPQNYVSSRACYFGSVRSSYNVMHSVVWRPMSANMWLNFNSGIFSFCSKTFSWITYSILFRADLEHPIIKWEN